MWQSYHKKISFADHCRPHTWEKPYQCSKCDKALSNNSHLQTHKMTHNGEKPNECSQCDIFFTKKKCIYIADHCRTHNRENLYNYSKCDKAYSQNIHLQYKAITKKLVLQTIADITLGRININAVNVNKAFSYIK